MGAAIWRGARRTTAATGRWFDTKTGHRGSTAATAARGATGFRARRQAARDALRNQSNHRPFLTGLFALVAALFAGIGATVGRAREKWHATADQELTRVLPPEEKEEHAHGAGGERDAAHERATREPPPWRREEPTADNTDNDNTDTPNTNDTESTPNPNTTTPDTAAGGTSMSGGLPHAQMAAEMASLNYEPDDAYQVIDESKQWPDAVRDFALGIRSYAQRLQMARFPLTTDSLQRIEELYEAISKIIPAAEEIHPALSRDHETDLARRDAPRGDESKWNV